jgi:hypothetical protein
MIRKNKFNKEEQFRKELYTHLPIITEQFTIDKFCSEYKKGLK